jgi:glycosyltransferase involved in cell wall biosynthesis
LPVIEAMSFGKPVFLSNLTSLPEIGGGEAYYFSDFEPNTLIEAFANGMKQFENNPGKGEKLRSWAARFSWEKSAKQYIQFYQKVLATQN